ncbi:MAG: DUF2142 domain-containing protein [Rickettsiales bacterium]
MTSSNRNSFFTTKPQYIFAIFSFIAGFILTLLIPPIGGIDENHHIRRISDISHFEFLNPRTYTEDPLSLWVDNGWVVRKNYHENHKKWYFNDIEKIKIEQPTEQEIEIDKNIFAVGNPVIYFPFAMLLKLINFVFHPEIWLQFYIIRFLFLISSVTLFTIAIAKIAEHKILLATVGMLPVMLYNRSGVNADGLLIGCSALFIITIYNLCEAYHKDNSAKITGKNLTSLFIWGFLTAQVKGAYLPLLFLVLLIPKNMFRSKKNRLLNIIILVIPAVICSLIWSNYARQEILSGVKYFVEGGAMTWPDGQFEWIISHPLSFATVIIKTIFASPIIPNSVSQMVGYLGWNGFHISVLSAVILLLMVFAIAAYEPANNNFFYKSSIKKLFVIAILLATFTLMLTMLYVQWTGYKSDIVLGFQGRYFYPLIPALLFFVKPITTLQNKNKATLLLWLFSFISATSVIYSTIVGNY